MPDPADASFKEQRRRTRAPYRVPARLQIAGDSSPGWWVNTIDASQTGVRVRSPHAVPLVPVLIELPTPNRATLTVAARVIYSKPIAADQHEIGVEFDHPHASFSAAMIDFASYGT